LAELAYLIPPDQSLAMKNDASSGISVFRLLAGTLGWTAVIVQWVATLALPTGPSELTRTVTYFSYFTTLTNIVAAASLTVPEVAEHWRVSRFLLRYEVRTAVAVYMIVTWGGYAILLAGVSKLTEIQYLADVVLHYVMPPLFLIDWLLIRPTRRISWTSILYFLAFPILFGCYTLVRGAYFGVYPYSFFDVNQIGYRAVLTNGGVFLILILGFGVLLIAIGRWRALAATNAQRVYGGK
jgi:hypothetical protein